MSATSGLYFGINYTKSCTIIIMNVQSMFEIKNKVKVIE